MDHRLNHLLARERAAEMARAAERSRLAAQAPERTLHAGAALDRTVARLSAVANGRRRDRACEGAVLLCPEEA